MCSLRQVNFQIDRQINSSLSTFLLLSQIYHINECERKSVCLIHTHTHTHVSPLSLSQYLSSALTASVPVSHSLSSVQQTSNAIFSFSSLPSYSLCISSFFSLTLILSLCIFFSLCDHLHTAVLRRTDIHTLSLSLYLSLLTVQNTHILTHSFTLTQHITST